MVGVFQMYQPQPTCVLKFKYSKNFKPLSKV